MVIDPGVLMVVSFMVLMAGCYMGLVWLVDAIIRWSIDSGWFWFTVAPVATAIWLSNIW